MFWCSLWRRFTVCAEVQHKIPVPEKVEIISSAKKTRRAIADVEIDVKSLMKDHSRKAPTMKKEADHIHSTVELPVATKVIKAHFW